MAFHVNCLLSRRFTWNVMLYFLRKIKKRHQNIICCSLRVKLTLLWTIGPWSFAGIRLSFSCSGSYVYHRLFYKAEIHFYTQQSLLNLAHKTKTFFPQINFSSFLFKERENSAFLQEPRTIGLAKSGYREIFFLISPWKHMLRVPIRSASLRHSNEYPQHMFSQRNKKNINTFGLKKHLI